MVSCLSRGAHAARLGHEEPISSCFRSSNCISGIGKTPCAEAKGEGSTESCQQEDQEGERRPGNPFSIDFLKLTNFLLTKPHIFRCGNGKEAAEPKHVPAVLTALEGLCLSLFDCFCPHVTSLINILFQ